MTHVITRLCIRGGECIEVCPVSCIVPGPAGNAEWPYLYIDPDGCIDCGACVPECPVEAIFPDFEVPAIYTEDIERNRQFFLEWPGYCEFNLEDLKKERLSK